MLLPPTNLDARRKQLNDSDLRVLGVEPQENPVFASIIGDKRYNDQLGSTSGRLS